MLDSARRCSMREGLGGLCGRLCQKSACKAFRVVLSLENVLRLSLVGSGNGIECQLRRAGEELAGKGLKFYARSGKFGSRFFEVPWKLWERQVLSASALAGPAWQAGSCLGCTVGSPQVACLGLIHCFNFSQSSCGTRELSKLSNMLAMQGLALQIQVPTIRNQASQHLRNSMGFAEIQFKGCLSITGGKSDMESAPLFLQSGKILKGREHLSTTALRPQTVAKAGTLALEN